jgi:hypothetical protein
MGSQALYPAVPPTSPLNLPFGVWNSMDSELGLFKLFREEFWGFISLGAYMWLLLGQVYI